MPENTIQGDGFTVHRVGDILDPDSRAYRAITVNGDGDRIVTMWRGADADQLWTDRPALLAYAQARLEDAGWTP